MPMQPSMICATKPTAMNQGNSGDTAIRLRRRGWITRAYTVGLGRPSIEESAEFKWNMHNPISKAEEVTFFSVCSLRRLLAPKNVLLLAFAEPTKLLRHELTS